MDIARARLILIADWPTLERRWASEQDALAMLRQVVLAAASVGAGPRMVLMDRDQRDGGSVRPRLRRLEALRRLTADAGVGLVVNQRADLALAVSADGVQLPERGLPAAAVRASLDGLGVGRSCHDRAGLLQAAHDGAHWATLAPVFAPVSKQLPSGARALGPNGFARAVDGVDLPVFALGGVTARNAAALSRVAVIGAVLLDESPAEAVVGLLQSVGAI